MTSWLWHYSCYIEAESTSNMFTQHSASIKLEHQYAGIWHCHIGNGHRMAVHAKQITRF